jgi:phage terminase large subunit GpA-like protein
MVVDLFHGLPTDAAARVVADAIRSSLPLTPKLRASEWIETHFRIPEGLSEYPGPVDLLRSPHAILPTDLFCDGEVDQVVLALSAQLSKTQIPCLGGMAFTSLHLRMPLGYLMPTQSKMDENVEQKILPTLLECVGGDDAVRSSKLARITFAGGNSQFHYGGNSPTAIKGVSIPRFIVDERDDDNMHPESLTKAHARGNAFPSRKRCMLQSSTYLDWGRGLHAETLTSQVYRYVVPCPHCGTYQELHFRGPNESGVVWDKPPKGESWNSERAIALAKNTAWYRCRNHACVQGDAGGRIEHRHKEWMMAMGVWVAKDPYDTGGDVEHVEVRDVDRLLATRELPRSELGRVMLARRTYDQIRDESLADEQHGVHVEGGQGLPARVAFEMGSVYSLWMEFGELASLWVKNLGRMDRTLAGHYFGQPHREPGTRIEPSMVAKLCTPIEEPGGYPIGYAPPWAVLLSLQADLQRDRAVITIRAHGPNGLRSALVWVGEVPCAIGNNLAELDPLRTLTLPVWQRPADPPMPLACATVDSGDGERTPEVYLWAGRWSRERDRTGIGPRARPCKGEGGQSAAGDQPHRVRYVDPRQLSSRQKKHASMLARLGRFPVLRVNKQHYTAELFRRVRAAMAEGDDDGTLAAPVAGAWLYPASWEAGTDDAVCAACPGAVRMDAGRHFKELTAVEGRTTENKKNGTSKFEFVVIAGRDDHSLDAERYGLADVAARGIASITSRPDLVRGGGASPAAVASPQPADGVVRRQPSRRGAYRA